MTITSEFARYIIGTTTADIPANVTQEAIRSLLNWMGCAVGGSRHPAVERSLAAVLPFSAGPDCSLIGRHERVDALHASLLNGISAHVLDFDDTHLRTLLHPSGPVASVLLALAERQRTSGREFVLAFVLGVEIECRIANAIWPGHNTDWYITGTTGVFGAAAAASKVLRLDEKQFMHALGLASAQAAGIREMAGTMAKSFVHGRAGQNGLLAALLAQQGFTASDSSLEGRHGFAQVFASRHDVETVTEGLGSTYEILQNTYKPFACGVVVHPVIDACIRLRNAHHPDGSDIEKITLFVHPRTLELAGNQSPQSGLKSKWSVYHSAAVSILDGAAGEHQYSDERVDDPVVRSLRERTAAIPDTHIKDTEAKVSVKLKDGRVIDEHVVHVMGSTENPMSDQALAEKVQALSQGILPSHQVAELISTCWGIMDLEDTSRLVRLSTQT
ncbi:MAG TPA: MmgE/PrpD family protein [Burkholderiales bacterium]|nr:MmgE/PrpD family protein [Burkholderiales bacterium]